MGSVYTRKIKKGHATDFDVVMRIGNEVRRVLAGIVGVGVDSEEFKDEVRTQFQPDPEGNLAIIGWIGRDPVEGVPDHNYDEQVEWLPPVYSLEKTEEQRKVTESTASEPPPFPIA